MLAVLLLDKVEESIVIHIANTLSRTFKSKIKVLEVGKIPKMAFDPSREQYLADTILTWLEKRCSHKSLAITLKDLYTFGTNFIFGQAQLRGRIALISLCRLDPEFYGKEANRKLLIERAKKEAVHEVGHLFGLVHCKDKGCVMCFSNSIVEVDEKSSEPCDSCKRLLQAGK